MAEVRCAVHPGRPAVDRCPVCDRPRCGADLAAGREEGCEVCRGERATDRDLQRPAPHFELLVRALVAANLSATAWSFVLAEYVDAPLFKYLAPMVLGILVGAVASAAAGSPRGGRLGHQVRVVSVGYAVLGAGLGFVLEGTYSARPSSLHVLIPYAIAAAGAWLWTAPPRAVRSSEGS